MVTAAIIGVLLGVPPNAAGAAPTLPGQSSTFENRVTTDKAAADLDLAHRLAGDHLLTIDGRLHRVLGSKALVDPAGSSETVLLVRDETSGQITHHLPALQFSLIDGADYETFILEHPGLTRLFVNPLYAQVGIDVADVAAQYATLSRDSRVVKLRLMSRAALVKPK